MRVTWHLLGATEVRVDGVVVPPPPPASRALLARLLLSAGRVVPATTLIDVLWGEKLPADPSNALQTRVAKLRRSLVASGIDADAIATRAPGYAADVDAETVDVLHFEREISGARSLLETADSHQVRQRLEEALALWHGPPLADVPSGNWVDVERTRIVELRLAALEDWLALVAETDPGRAVPEIEALIAEHPLREGLTKLLMLSLYRLGRQADALMAYERLRGRLEEDLGLDPAPDLRALHQAILRQDATLSGSAAPRRQDGPSPPAAPRVPSRLSSFVGRSEDLREVAELLSDARLVTVTGMGGIGKTSLALEVARDLAESHGTAVHIVRLASVEPGSDVAGAVAETLGLSLAAPETTVEQFAAVLGAGRHLVLLDNCEHVVDSASWLVERLLGRCPELRVLATSREALVVPGEVQWALAPLSTEAAGDGANSEAVQLFMERAAMSNPAIRLDDEARQHVTEICNLLDGVPLAIELSAARLRLLPLEQLRATLESRLDILSAASTTSRHSSIDEVLEWSYATMSARERTLLERLSVFRGTWSLQAAEAVCGFGQIEPRDVLQLVSRLVDRSMVVPDPQSGRFRLLYIVQDFCFQRIGRSDDFGTTVTAHMQWCRAYAQANGANIRTSLDVLAEFTLEGPNLRAALERSLDPLSRDVELGFQVALGMVWYWSQGLRAEGVHFLESLLATGEGDAKTRALALQGVALLLIYYPTARSSAAGRESLAYFERAGDTVEAARSRLIVTLEGMYGKGEVTEYRTMIDQSRRELADADGGWWRAITFYFEALLLLRDADFEAAASSGRAAIDLLRGTGDRGSLSAALSHLAIALRMQGQLDESIARCREALTVIENGSVHAVAFAYVHLGHALLDRGASDEAEQSLILGREAAQRVANPRCEAWGLWGLARIAFESGDSRGAYEMALPAVERLKGQEFPWAVKQLTAFIDSLGGTLDLDDSGTETDLLDR